MSSYCNCCSTDEQWAEDHLTWDIDPEGDIREQAEACLKFWAEDGDPIKGCTVDDLERLFLNMAYKQEKQAELEVTHA